MIDIRNFVAISIGWLCANWWVLFLVYGACLVALAIIDEKASEDK